MKKNGVVVFHPGGLHTLELGVGVALSQLFPNLSPKPVASVEAEGRWLDWH